MDVICVINAEHIAGFEVKLRFNNGTEGTVNLENHLKGKVFEPLRNEKYFRNFKLNSWTIEWENGADFAPEYLYNLVKESIVLT